MALSAQTITNGGTYTWTFTEALIAIETANEGQNLCGARQYNVYMPDGSTEVTGDWMTITETSTGNYELVANPIADSLVTGSALALVFKTTLPSQPSHIGLAETLSTTIAAAVCDCSLITWDNPVSAATLSVGVFAVSGNTVTIPEAAYNVASTTASPEIRVCASTTPCDMTFTSALIDTTLTTLPTFMSVSGTTLTVTATTAADIGTWNLQLTQTVASGTSPVFTSVIVTVDCTLTDVANPTNPSTQTYNIYDPTMLIDLTALGVIYTQTPPCELAVTESHVWTIPAGATAVTEVSGNPMQLSIVSNKNTEAGTFTVTLVNNVALSSQSFTDNPTVSFDIEVIDPCTITTIHDVTVNSITMVLGDVHTQTFAEATVQTETDNGGLDLCGSRVYLMVDDSDVAISWMAITYDSSTSLYTITSSPTDESLIGSTLSYHLKITFANADYSTPVKRMAVPTTITDATCNCDLLTWDTPTRVDDAVEVALGPKTVNFPTATQNELSKTTTPAVRKCFASSGTCPFTSTWTPTSLEAFIVQTGTTDEVIATPTTAAHMGTWIIEVTQTVTYTNFGTTATIVFDGIQIVVGCTITDVPNPSAPTTGLTYTLYDPSLAIDLVTIPFTQSPPCEYVATESVVWTNPEPNVIMANPF